MANGHYAAANFLLEKHDLIIQPILKVKELTDTGKRNFGSKAARAMYTWSHYQFRQRLKSAATRYPGRHVYETTEPGTSKTCTHCGFWHAGLKLGDKVYDCPRCHIQVDRQLAGARNNFFAAYGLAVGRGWDGA
jgi:transposase